MTCSSLQFLTIILYGILPNKFLKGVTTMTYTKEQLESIERVKSVFADYLKNSRTLDLIWSDKLGYVLITGITKDMSDFVMQPEVIYTAERLCDHLLYEIACDVLESRGHCHDIYISTPFEKQLILEAYQPYMCQLPEYSHMLEIHFTDTANR